MAGIGLITAPTNPGAFDAAGAAAAAQAASLAKMPRASVKTAAYTTNGNEVVPVDTATPNANVTVTVASGLADGTRVTVKHIAVGAGKTVSVALSGSDVFNKTGGVTTATLTLLNQAITVQKDAGIWTVVSDDLPKSALDGAYAPLSGADTIALGDSITAQNSDATNNVTGDTHYAYFAAFSGGRVKYGRNAGISGNTTAQMVARLTTDVIAYAPQRCLIVAGTNDTDPINQTLANLTSIITSLRAAGIDVMLGTIPPAGTAAINPPTATATPATTGGTLADGTYGYRVSAVNGVGETTAAATVTAIVSGGAGAGSVALSWPRVLSATAYKVYGRTSGSELLIATVSAGGGTQFAACGYLDTGSVTPTGALPGANTTAVALSGSVRTKITGVNSVIHHLARKYACPLVDYYQLLVDGATGMYQTGWTSDGTHPVPYAAKLMGRLAADKLTDRYPPGLPYLAGDNADPSNLLANGLMLTGSATLPTSWGASGSTATAVTTLAADARVVGNALTVTRTGIGGHFLSAPQITSGFAVGDVIGFSFLFKVTGADDGGGQLAVRLKCVGSSGASDIGQLLMTADVPDWTPFYFETAVPAGTTALELDVNTAYGPINAAVAQLTVRNKTTLGVAA